MSLTVLVLLALAAYRLTRLVVIDGLFDEVREGFFKKLDFRYDKASDTYQSRNLLAQKLSYLFQCTWCTGVWVSAGVYWLYTRDFVFLDVAAVAGLQGLLHAFEPSE